MILICYNPNIIMHLVTDPPPNAMLFRFMTYYYQNKNIVYILLLCGNKLEGNLLGPLVVKLIGCEAKLAIETLTKYHFPIL